MALILPLFFGFLTALVGVAPPGIINMTAARISLQDGKTRAMMFTLGASVVVFIQTLVAIVFAQYIDGHKEVVILLREIGFGIFTILTIYFIFIAKAPKVKLKDELRIKSKKSRFFLGMLISAINFFPIPYYVFVSITLASYGYFTFDTISGLSFVIGVVLGSFAVFYAYMAYFQKIESKAVFLLKNMNIIMGTITGLVSLLTLYNILRYYYKF
ncbi:lysine transporter LysE [Flavobacterium terrae]|uniref:Threonine/homoserine/homoserine lactone efflux protein n=1 Tax=Flavobacterium terrae TaxID=415425 RepID=A0A1M6BDE0_9FLAO|nr:lysine transporter LysE [Flavobacterium terrae]SHI46473.1 Threonine/homoserine/homoserine lactone efflux protein [Flavobacterium terrae]